MYVMKQIITIGGTILGIIGAYVYGPKIYNLAFRWVFSYLEPENAYIGKLFEKRTPFI